MSGIQPVSRKLDVSMNMDPNLVKEWKRGYDEVNRFTDAERRDATYAQRYRDLKALWRRASNMRLFKSKPVDEEVMERWNLLRARHETDS